MAENHSRGGRFEYWGIAIDPQAGNSLAIPQTFAADQPNHFGAPPATATPLVLGGFVGQAELGGCNVSLIEVVPHCNGTHTESVQHIVTDECPISSVGIPAFQLAELITVATIDATNCDDESYRAKFAADDQWITAASIKRARSKIEPVRARLNKSAGLVATDESQPAPTALIVRTLPNGLEKVERKYAQLTSCPPYFTMEAMEYLVASNVQHLLVDVPSIDRSEDGGLLCCHHVFWQVPEGSRQLRANTRVDSTITELIYVRDAIGDGLYLLNLQVPGWQTDAAPSRPIIWPLICPPNEPA